MSVVMLEKFSRNLKRNFLINHSAVLLKLWKKYSGNALLSYIILLKQFKLPSEILEKILLEKVSRHKSNVILSKIRCGFTDESPG